MNVFPNSFLFQEKCILVAVFFLKDYTLAVFKIMKKGR
ncbi:hypothetical protein J2Z52_000446 [Enterococcus rivorum]|nr:hypothetical protein [Enterococcus rivorum]